MMQCGNGTPDDPPPGNASSMPGWNSQWSLEHQQFYYVNTSTGERRWYLPTVPIPPQGAQTKPQPVAAVASQKIQRKAVGAQSIRSNQASPVVAITQNVQANTGTVRAPLLQAKDSYFPPPTVQGQYQPPQPTKPLTPAPTPTQSQPPPQTPYQQLDFSGRFASLSVEHSRAEQTNVPGAWPNQDQPPQTVLSTQPQPKVADIPVSPMMNQPNAHNFSSQPSNIHYSPPPPPTQYQSLPTPQSPDPPALYRGALAPSLAQKNVGISPLTAAQPVLTRVPPPPPRNLIPYQTQQMTGQIHASPVVGPSYSLFPNPTVQYSVASQATVLHQQQQQQQKQSPSPLESSQQYPTVPGAFPPTQQQRPSESAQTQPLQRHDPPPIPGCFQQISDSGQQLNTSPRQYAAPCQSPPVGQNAFAPPPPPVDEMIQPQVAGAWPHQSLSTSQDSSPQALHPAQFQRLSAKPISGPSQPSSYPLPSSSPQQQQSCPPSVQIQYADPAGKFVGQTAIPQHYNASNRTPPPLHHYPSAPISTWDPYQSSPQQGHAPSAPPLHRYSSAPETITYQQGMIPTQSTNPSTSGEVRNPYAQQVAHANSFYGPPPQRLGSMSHVLPQRMPVPQGQNQTSFQHNQEILQAPGFSSAYSPQPGQTHQQFQTQSQPQSQHQNPYHSQPAYHTPIPTPPLPPPRKSSNTLPGVSTSGMLSKMTRQFSDLSKTATEKTKRFSVSQPALKKWGTRAAVGIVAVGALALGVDAVGDAAGFLEGAEGGGGFGGGEDFSGGGGDYGGGDLGGGGGGEEFGGGGESAADAQTAVDANAAQLAMEQAGRENALMLLDPVGTEYEPVYESRAIASVDGMGNIG